MTFARIAAALGLALILAGCLPVTTKTPVGSTTGLGTDTALYGTWIGHTPDGDASPIFHFLARDDESMTVILVTPPHGTDKGDWSVYGVRASKLGANRFLNVQEISSNGKPPGSDAPNGTFPLLYRTAADGSVTLYLMDEKLAAGAIKTGKIAGEVEPGENGDVHITADAKTLDAFMQTRAGLALFAKPLIRLTRMK